MSVVGCQLSVKLHANRTSFVSADVTNEKLCVALNNETTTVRLRFMGEFLVRLHFPGKRELRQKSSARGDSLELLIKVDAITVGQAIALVGHANHGHHLGEHLGRHSLAAR